MGATPGYAVIGLDRSARVTGEMWRRDDGPAEMEETEWDRRKEMWALPQMDILRLH